MRYLAAALLACLATASSAQAPTELEKRMPEVTEQVRHTLALRAKTFLRRPGYTCRHFTAAYLDFLGTTIAMVEEVSTIKRNDLLTVGGLSPKAIINRGLHQVIERWQRRLPEWRHEQALGPGTHDCTIYKWHGRPT